jgi:HAD superfamily phosphatase (TIGR01668 family)
MDRDNTCVPRDSKVAPPAVMQWIDSVHEAGIPTCIVSNNFHTKQVSASARELGCGFIDHAMKPAPFALLAGLKREGIPAEQAVMVGDQLFTDVLAANLAGIRPILVLPQSRVDLWYTQLFRIGEGMFLRGIAFEGEDAAAGGSAA